MIDIAKMEYQLLCTTGGGSEYNITDAVINLGWEENDGEISSRITFDANNAAAKKKKLSSIVKLGGLVRVVAKYGGDKKEVARGRVTDWDPIKTQTEDKVQYVTYDELHDLEQSQDYFYFEKGQNTEGIVSQILGKWGIPIGKYEGPSVAHEKIKFDTDTLADDIISILDDGAKKGGPKSFLRATKGKAEIVQWGKNDPIYALTTETGLSFQHSKSTQGMITRVIILSKESKGTRPQVQATVDGLTQYGIRQKIVRRDKDATLDEAKKSAQDILDDKGKLKDTITLKHPDVPYIRKGDKVYCKGCGLKGYYYVKGIRHDVDAREMTLDVTSKP